MKSLESWSKPHFSIGAMIDNDCEFVNMMAEERGLPKYDSNLFEIPFISLSFRFLCSSPNFVQQIDNLVEPENRMSLVVTPFNLEKLYKTIYKTGVSSVFMLDENVTPYYWGYMTNLVMKDIIYLKATQLFESGIFSHYMKQFYLEDFGPQVLTLQHLEAGFVIICGLLSLSVLAFIIECTPKVIKKMFEMCLVCYIVVKFTKMNKML
jgi:hypothetical protein